MSTIKVNAIQNTSGVEVYTAKAWVNFNGTGTVAIRASGNVTSITDNAVGDYTLNFTNSLADSNYAVALYSNGLGGSGQMQLISKTTSSLRVGTGDRMYAALLDGVDNSVAIFR